MVNAIRAVEQGRHAAKMDKVENPDLVRELQDAWQKGTYQVHKVKSELYTIIGNEASRGRQSDPVLPIEAASQIKKEREKEQSDLEKVFRYLVDLLNRQFSMQVLNPTFNLPRCEELTQKTRMSNLRPLRAGRRRR